MVDRDSPENRPDLEPIAPDLNTPDPGSPESDATAPAAIERRLARNLSISIVLFILLAAIFGPRPFAFGVAIGGALAYLNYRWLHSSLKTLFNAVASGAPPPNAFQSVSKFISRWLLILAAVALAYQWGGRMLTLGITVGLLSIAAAAMMEAFTQAWWLLRSKSE